jgi:TolB protein
MNVRWTPGLSLLGLLAALPALAQREPVLKQIALPHKYYYREMYLPQATSGPSAVVWSPDGGERWWPRFRSPVTGRARRRR